MNRKKDNVHPRYAVRKMGMRKETVVIRKICTNDNNASCYNVARTMVRGSIIPPSL